MGLMFQHLHDLDELVLTYNRIKRLPAKGFGDTKLKRLDLRNNEILLLSPDNFVDLNQLVELHLSHNHLTELVSGVFFHMTGLLHLDLSFNRVRHLHSSTFLNLKRLAFLNLNGNPLASINASTFKTLSNLKHLSLADCGIKQLHSLSLDGLHQLRTLDLQSNVYDRIRTNEFKSIPSLETLLLGRNRIRTVEMNAFAGFRRLGLHLSSNLIEKLEPCALCNASIRRLNFSKNSINQLLPADLRPLENFLEELDLSYNFNLQEQQLASALAAINSLQVCKLAHMDLNDDFNYSQAFTPSSKTLVDVDLSSNHFHNLTANRWPTLKRLRHLDLSSNRIVAFDLNATHMLAELLRTGVNLTSIRLHQNSFSCRLCDLAPFWSFLQTKPKPLTEPCDQNTKECAVCVEPNYMRGQRLDLLTHEMLASCDPLDGASKRPFFASKLAFIIGLVSISLIVVLIVLAIIRNKYKGAIYYTDEPRNKSIDAKYAETQVSTICNLQKTCSLSAMSGSEDTGGGGGGGSYRMNTSGQTSFHPLPHSPPHPPPPLPSPPSFVPFNGRQGDHLSNDQILTTIVNNHHGQSNCISQDVIDHILSQVEKDLRYADDIRCNTINEFNDLNDGDHFQNLADEFQFQSDSLTMPSSMTALETYVRCYDVHDLMNDSLGQRIYDQPTDAEPTSVKTIEMSSRAVLI